MMLACPGTGRCLANRVAIDTPEAPDRKIETDKLASRGFRYAPPSAIQIRGSTANAKCSSNDGGWKFVDCPSVDSGVAADFVSLG